MTRPLRPIRFRLRELLQLSFVCAVYFGVVVLVPDSWRVLVAVILGWLILSAIYVRFRLFSTFLVHCAGPAILLLMWAIVVSLQYYDLAPWHWGVDLQFVAVVGFELGILFSLPVTLITVGYRLYRQTR